MKHTLRYNKLIQLLVMSLNGDKILLSLGIEIIGVDCVFRELGLVQRWSNMLKMVRLRLRLIYSKT